MVYLGGDLLSAHSAARIGSKDMQREEDDDEK